MTAPAWMREKAAAYEARVADAQRRRREQMPTVAGIVDQVRAFFPQAQVVHADEGNGRTFGKEIPREETLSSTEVLAMLRAEKDLGTVKAASKNPRSAPSVMRSAANQQRRA